MPVLETDFLKAYIDAADALHRAASKASARLLAGEWRVASSAFLELDLLLKNAGVHAGDRYEIFQSLRSEIPLETILVASHDVLSKAALLQKRYPIKSFYFDSIHLSTALSYDRMIVSSDKEFDQISEVRRLALEKL